MSQKIVHANATNVFNVFAGVCETGAITRLYGSEGSFFDGCLWAAASLVKYAITSSNSPTRLNKSGKRRFNYPPYVPTYRVKPALRVRCFHLVNHAKHPIVHQS